MTNEPNNLLEDKDNYPKGLLELLATEEVKSFRDQIFKSSALVEINGEQHTTQAFETAEDIKNAFSGNLEKMDDIAVSKQMTKALIEYKDLINDNNISPQELRGMLEKVWIYSRLTSPSHEQLEETISMMEHAEKSALFASGLAGVNAVVEQFTNGSDGNLRQFLVEELESKYGFGYMGGYRQDENWSDNLTLEELKNHYILHEGRNPHKNIFKKMIEEFTKNKLNNAYKNISEKAVGDKIVVVGAIYGGSYAQLMDSCKETGRRYQHLPISEFEKNGLPEDTSMVLFESCNNPNLNIIPINKVTKNAKEISKKTGKDIKVVCDNTFTPVSVNPLDQGADLVLHSMTKYLNGKSEDLGGVVSGDADLIAQLSDLKSGKRMTKGGVMAPRVAKEFLNNMKDLIERIYFASLNARQLKDLALEFGFNARTPESNDEWSNIKNADLPVEFNNGMITIDFGNSEKAQEFVDTMSAMGVGKLAVSLGAKTTYYCIPAETTHSEMSSDEQLKAGITPGLVRISCGIEHDLTEKATKVFAELAKE